MNLRQWGTVLGALLLGAGCSHGSAANTNQMASQAMTQPGAGAQPGVATPESISREKDMLMSQADGTQPGKIRSFTGDTITVDSQGVGAPTTMTMRIDSSVPVFQGTQKVGTDALAPGQDVRVFYKNPPDNTQPQAIAVEITPAAAPTPDNTQGSTPGNVPPAVPGTPDAVPGNTPGSSQDNTVDHSGSTPPSGSMDNSGSSNTPDDKGLPNDE